MRPLGLCFPGRDKSLRLMALVRSVEHLTRSRGLVTRGKARVLLREDPVAFGQTTGVQAHQAVLAEDYLAAQAALADQMVQVVLEVQMGQVDQTVLAVQVDQTVLAVQVGQMVLVVREDQTDPPGVPEDQEVQEDPEVTSVLIWPKWLSIRSSIWSC